ncbi:hypothetical protein RFI_09205 [Reticulomyxa filosa]|uniref:Guanylate cyclase domain-containing protein n=1 Tax=Reticulomyxa filosa TaxID=46433 RepID=X6NRH9_RETFI|nr:hypothetical protein RFI_09205 [Reticulomyxa filosa]|eukprot:ETO27927.1 hypothetical protein RFI_09205 [Reticulomyxa filosa]
MARKSFSIPANKRDQLGQVNTTLEKKMATKKKELEINKDTNGRTSDASKERRNSRDIKATTYSFSDDLNTVGIEVKKEPNMLHPSLLPNVATFTYLPGMDNSVFDPAKGSVTPNQAMTEQDNSNALGLPKQATIDTRKLNAPTTISNHISSSFSHGHIRSKSNLPTMAASLHYDQSHSRTKSQMSLAEMADWSPPTGPDLTFMCTCIENKTALSNGLSDAQMTELMAIHNDIIVSNVKKYHGFVIEKGTIGKVYDFFVVFGDVCNALDCAVAIQQALQFAPWPSFYFNFEETGKLQYVGKPAESFCGLRVGICLHTGRVGDDTNPFDLQKETLSMEEKMMFDVEYKGTCVELCKEMCHYVFGGELLSTNATKVALSQSQMSPLFNNFTIQVCGVHHFLHLRTAKLVSFIWNGYQRYFPLKTLNGGTSEHNKYVSAETINYDPFPAEKSDASDELEEDNENANVNTNVNVNVNARGDEEKTKEKMEAEAFAIPQPKASHRNKQVELEKKRTSQKASKEPIDDSSKDRKKRSSVPQIEHIVTDDKRNDKDDCSVFFFFPLSFFYFLFFIFFVLTTHLVHDM